jgi:CheY-like chemotaxis protein
MCNVVGEVFTDALVQECEDIASALQQLEQGTIDLVLLDLSMPDADGIEGLSRLRAAAPATPVIVCSARDDPALVRDCFKLGIAGYLPKSSGMEVTRSWGSPATCPSLPVWKSPVTLCNWCVMGGYTYRRRPLQSRPQRPKPVQRARGKMVAPPPSRPVNGRFWRCWSAVCQTRLLLVNWE